MHEGHCAPTVLSWSPLECRRQAPTKGPTLSTSDTRVEGTPRAPRARSTRSSPAPDQRASIPHGQNGPALPPVAQRGFSAARPRPMALSAPRPGLLITGPHAAYCTPRSPASTTWAQIPPQLRKSRSGGAGPELPAAAKLLLHGAAQGWSRCEPDTSPERGLTVTVSAGPRAERKTHAQRAHFRPPEGPQALRVSAALPAAGCARPPVRSPREVSVAMPDGNHRCSISIPRGVILSLNAAFKY